MTTIFAPFTIVFQECKSGRWLAWYQNRSDIIANGDTKQEAEDNLKTLYKSVVPFSYKAIIAHENFIKETILPDSVIIETKTIKQGDKTYNILGEDCNNNHTVYIRFSYHNEHFVKEFIEVWLVK